MYIIEEKTDTGIKIGDYILAGKFKNKRCKVTGFTVDANNQPRVKTDKGEFNIYSFRLEKLMTQKKENKQMYLNKVYDESAGSGKQELNEDLLMYKKWLRPVLVSFLTYGGIPPRMKAVTLVDDLINEMLVPDMFNAVFGDDMNKLIGFLKIMRKQLSSEIQELSDPDSDTSKILNKRM
jgi:hypothetical protein